MQNYQRVYDIGERCYDKKKLTQEEKNFLIHAYYEKMLVRLTPNCSNCYAKIYQYFLTLKINPNMSEQKCDFKLKQGKRITLHGMTDDLSNANITNEKAVLFLKASPACAKFFEVLPSNWRDMTQAIGKPEPTSKKVEAPVTEETVQPDGKEKDFSADEFKLDKIREDNLKKKSEQQLVKMCESLELDSKLFKGKKKEQLIKLLIEKMS